MSEAILPTQIMLHDKHHAKDWAIAKAIYTFLMAIALLSHLWLLTIGAGIDDIPIYIWITRLLTVPFAIFLGKLYKDKGFWILSLYILLFFLRCFIPDSNSIFSVDAANSVLSALWLFASCYGMGKIIKGEQLKRFLGILVSVWTIGITIYSCLGIYCVWNDAIIKTPRNGLIVNWNGRLEPIYYTTIAGAILSLSALLALISCLSVKKTINKVLFLTSFILIITTLAFTDSRTAYISVSIGIGCIAAIIIQRKQILRHIETPVLRWGIGIGILIGVFAISLLLIMQITPTANWLKNQGMIPTAYAENINGIQMEQRGFGGDDVLNGRSDIWGKILQYISSNLQVLLFGESKITPMKNIDPSYGHCHNMLLQMIVESGLPGCCIVIAFVLITTKRGISTINVINKPLWIVLLLSVVVSIIAGELVECFTWLRSSQCPMGTCLFLISGVICEEGKPHNDKIFGTNKDLKNYILSSCRGKQ